MIKYSLHLRGDDNGKIFYALKNYMRDRIICIMNYGNITLIFSIQTFLKIHRKKYDSTSIEQAIWLILLVKIYKV